MAEKEAKYQRIIDWVKEGIASGTFVNGDRLMSEKELCDKFGLSRQTVRHATGELEKENIVTRVRGSGTYIGGIVQPLRGEKYHNIALVSTFYENYIFPPTIKGIERILSQNGFTMQVSFTDNRVSRERDILKTILEKDNVDGIIVEPAKSALPNPNIVLYEELKKRNIPILFFNATYPELSCPCVRIDDHQAGYLATKVLLDAGHREVAGIFKADDRQGHLRYAGYLDAMIEAGASVHQSKVLWIDTPVANRLADIQNYLFARLEGASGVVCYNDNIAYQLMELAVRRGLHVPGELSMVGVDDVNNSAPGLIPLTTIPHPKEVLGRKTAEMLISMIRNPGIDGNYVFSTEVIYRDSVRRLS